MRIAVKANCKGQGIGWRLTEDLLVKYPAHFSLDVSTDNVGAIGFYKRLGLEICKVYISEEKKVEFATFKTPDGFTYA